MVSGVSSISIPEPILAYVRTIFTKVNNEVTLAYTNQPNLLETTLDNLFVMAIQRIGGASKIINHHGPWVITLRADFLGSVPLQDRYEVADIGVVIEFRQNDKVLLIKSALLQSKKLYSDEKLYASGARIFSFGMDSKYREVKNDIQIQKILKFTGRSKIPVFYSLYNPWQIPLDCALPLYEEKSFRGRSSVGTRVVPSFLITSFVAKNNKSPTYSDLVDAFSEQEPISLLGFMARSAGWRIENWVADLILGCKIGHLGTPNDPDLREITELELRGRPITVALRITIEMPPQDSNLA
jgi:hypothetical protein